MLEKKNKNLEKKKILDRGFHRYPRREIFLVSFCTQNLFSKKKKNDEEEKKKNMIIPSFWISIFWAPAIRATRVIVRVEILKKQSDRR